MTLWRTTLRAMTLGIFLCPNAVELRGDEPTGAQVLFSFDRTAESSEQAPPIEDPVLRVPSTEIVDESGERSTAKVDPAVIKASHEATTPTAPLTSDRRRLAPQSRTDLLNRPLGENERSKLLPFEIPHVDSLGTAGAGLVLVVGLFLLCVSLMRRGGPNPSSPLPSDAVAVLGRVPLTPKQFAHLIQVGNKLVLVSITGERTDTITEITEPAEVERLLVMCHKGSRHSS